jgi:hypothetical protein
MDDDYEDNQGSPPLSPVRVTDAVKDIMGKIIAKASARNYARQNAHFALYCFESAELRDCLLEPWFVEKLGECRNVSAQKKYAYKCFEIMSAEDDNCPFVLSELTFAHFSAFLSTRTRTRGKNKGQPNSLGIASFDQAKSALVHLFRMSKYKMLEQMSDKLKMFMKGLKRHVASKKMESGDSQIVGKRKMDFKVYEKICEQFLKEEGEEFLFARCFLTLEWNLMARSESIVTANFFHITWEDDSLVFRFAKSKTDQTGRNTNQVWHVYATPDKPATCPVLALATYVFSNPGLTNICGESFNMDDDVGSSRLFPGGDQYGRFMACLHRVIENNLEEFLLLGIKPGDLGSHSARKGASSFASAGSTVSPPMVSICLRAMWSMGPVKERYLQYEKAGDQYLGRVVSGLDVNDVSFAVSPPYFESGIADDVSENINNLLKAFTVGGGNLSGEIFQVLYFCFASLCYHFDYLVGITPRRSKLQASPFFTNIPNYAREAAVVKFPWTKTASTPSFTGLPPHVCILAQLEELKAEIAKSKDEIIVGIKSDLDERRLGSQSYFDKEEIIAKMAEFHVEMMRKVEVVGRKSSTAIQAGYADADFSPGGGDQLVEGSADSVSTITASSAHTLVDKRGKRFQIFFSAGAISRVRPDFVFPKMTLCTLITCWFCGNESAKTVPFKLLRPMEITKVSERHKLSKMKVLMMAVQLAAERCDMWRAQRGTWDIGSTVRLYEAVRPYFTYPSKISVRRDSHISWNTVYNLYLKHDKTFAVDLS